RMRLAASFAERDAVPAVDAKVSALVRYLRGAPDEDAAWAMYFLAGGKPRQLVRTAALRALALQASGLPEWLFEESYQAVGDLAETIALVLPAPAEGASALGLAGWLEQRLLPLRGADEATVAASVLASWAELDALGRFLFIKLVSGGFRVGVSKLLVQRAVAQH